MFGRVAAAIAATAGQRVDGWGELPEVVLRPSDGSDPQIVNHEVWINEALWPVELGCVADPRLVGLVGLTWVDQLADVVLAVTLPDGGRFEGLDRHTGWIEHVRIEDSLEGLPAGPWAGTGSRPVWPVRPIAGVGVCCLSTGRLTTDYAIPWASVTAAACPCALAATVRADQLPLRVRAGEAWAAVAGWFALITRPSLGTCQTRIKLAAGALRRWLGLVARPGFGGGLPGELR
ncbi:MAG: hypothetical protein LBC97_14540 [Bifidobacteriaceae bacterium]|nr:hypothetical protein [Bifidobacteriaceae bacterium]